MLPTVTEAQDPECTKEHLVPGKIADVLIIGIFTARLIDYNGIPSELSVGPFWHNAELPWPASQIVTVTIAGSSPS